MQVFYFSFLRDQIEKYYLKTHFLDVLFVSFFGTGNLDNKSDDSGLTRLIISPLSSLSLSLSCSRSLRVCIIYEL